MKHLLDGLRVPKRIYSAKKQVVVTLGILALGIYLGVFSKYLDYRQAELPYLLQIIDATFDFHNFLGGFAPWLVIALCIAVYSCTPARAAVNVFAFFVGMVSGYYLYCNYVVGFFPRSYAMIWIGFTIISPLLAFISWYVKGKGAIAFILSSGTIGVLINTAFSYGAFYIDINSWLNVILLLMSVFILRKSLKEIIGMVGVGIVLAKIIETIIPFHIW